MKPPLVLTRLTPYLLITPTLLLVAIFTLLPAIRTVYDSLYQPARRAVEPSVFIGLQNYADLLDSTHYLGGRFLPILQNTVMFVFVSLMIAIPLALMFALMLNRQIRALGFWRFSLIYPMLLPLIGAASIWAFLYSDSIGLINTVMRSLGGQGQNWLGNPNLVLGSVIVVNIWKQAGYYSLFYLAGLQNISRDIYEAADLDGANSWQKLVWITVPLLRRTTLFVIVIAITFGFQTVEQLAALGLGNPADRSNLLLWFIFQNISERRNWGYVNAMTVILVSILLFFTVINFLVFERRGVEDDRA